MIKMDIKVICKNHGIIQTIPTGITWVGEPPKPYPFCPFCGEPTKIIYPDKDNSMGGSYWRSPTQEEIEEQKRTEIEHYRAIYWPEERK